MALRPWYCQAHPLNYARSTGLDLLHCIFPLASPQQLDCSVLLQAMTDAKHVHRQTARLVKCCRRTAS